MHSQIHINQAAQIIGVSSATLRNWVKAGHLQPLAQHPLVFSEESLAVLKNQLQDGTIQKLQTRANKAHSTHEFIPLEYSSVPTNELEAIVVCYKELRLRLEPTLFLAALVQLESVGECKIGIDPFDTTNHHFQRSSVAQEFADWCSQLGAIEGTQNYAKLISLLKPMAKTDWLGVLYQSLRQEGDKSLAGSYYTPTGLVQAALEEFVAIAPKNFLDPCCGTGQYLLEAAKLYKFEPEMVYGFDIDPIAVRLAKVNLFLLYKQEFKPQVFCQNTLLEVANGDFFCETNHLRDYFDVIATNPPWGAAKEIDVYRAVKSGETFSMFIVKSLELLKPTGRASFLLPEAILNIKAHADIRAYILDCCIEKIVQLGRRFHGVFTPVIRLDLQKVKPQKQITTLVLEHGDVTQTEQAKFSSNPDFVFDILDNTEQILLEKIYAMPHTTLRGQAQWALGIVTGDNKKYLLPESAPNLEPIYRGSDVVPFGLKPASNFIEFAPHQFQQVAPIHFYRATQKLVYKFISSQLVFALDTNSILTLNSANILIPQIPNMDMGVVMAFLNSSVLQFIFAKKFKTHKVLRGDLEKLPFPILTTAQHEKIMQLVGIATQKQQRLEELERLIFEVFELDPADIFQIQKAVS